MAGVECEEFKSSADLVGRLLFYRAVSSVECTFLVDNLGWKILVGNLEWKVFGGQYLAEIFAGKFWWTIWADFFGVNTIFVFVCIVVFVFTLSLP